MAKPAKSHATPQDDLPPATAPEGVAEADTRVKTQLRKKAFLDRVADRAGGNRAQAKAAAEAVLAELAAALAEGAEANLPPLGKLKVVKEKPGPRGRILMLRLALDPGKGVAAASEDD
jgi:DNA-binding protein HU-alpha